MADFSSKNNYSSALFEHMDYFVDFGEVQDLIATDITEDTTDVIDVKNEMVSASLIAETLPEENKSDLPVLAISTAAQKAWDRLLALRLKEKKLNNIKMYFILDEINLNQIGQESFNCFNEDAQNLFLKMTKAMGIDSSEFIISSLQLIDETENYDVMALVMQEIEQFAPKAIATFGAQAASLLLGRTERLAKIHGQFLTTRLQSSVGEAKLIEWMPLFHPDLLLINPNMKKTAWVDMQKLMLRF